MAIPFGTQRLDHLGLVVGMYDELGIGELVDELIPQDRTRRGVSVGQAVKAMGLNGLGFTNRTLYLSPQFFKNHPTERLIGPGIAPEHLNDDTLGRALDVLYECDVTVLFALLSAQAVGRLGLAGGVAHLDSTSFHVDGDYNRHDPPEAGVVHITPGYSRDHRPELCQVGLNLIVENKARLPLWMQPVNGNSNDTNRFGRIIESPIGQLQAEHGIRYWVADSALYSAENLQRLSAQSAKWITRGPETLTLACQTLETHAGRGQILAPGYLGHSMPVDYAGVSQRWLVVTSVHALQRGVKSVDRQLLADRQAELNAWLTLTRQRLACAADAAAALARFQNALKLLALEAIMDPNVRTGI